MDVFGMGMIVEILSQKINENYWRNKIARNQKRDIEVTEALIKKKWRVVRIWGCGLKNKTYISEVFGSIGFGSDIDV